MINEIRVAFAHRFKDVIADNCLFLPKLEAALFDVCATKGLLKVLELLNCRECTCEDEDTADPPVPSGILLRENVERWKETIIKLLGNRVIMVLKIQTKNTGFKNDGENNLIERKQLRRDWWEMWERERERGWSWAENEQNKKRRLLWKPKVCQNWIAECSCTVR